MKTFFVLMTLVTSLHSFAANDSISTVLDQPEVEKLSAEKKEAGLLLSKVEDVYAEAGVSPRCPCESMKLTFTKTTQVNGSPVKKVEVYSVTTNGFGTNLKVTIKKNK